MSEPREFWIDDTGCDDFITDDKRTGESNNCIHVIEKSAADKLAEAIEKHLAGKHDGKFILLDALKEFKEGE